MKATEFDRKFDDGEDMTEHLDWSKAIRPNARRKQVDCKTSDEMEVSDARRAPFQNSLQRSETERVSMEST